MALPSFYNDRYFLQQINSLKIKQQYVKITVLDWQEYSIEQVQGICISGNLNISADSPMRRTATISILAEEKENNLANLDNLFAINKKCKLELGIKNTIPKYYPLGSENNPINYQTKYGDIVWFPLGIFIMFNPSISHDASGCTISMNLKDKMCLLNGDVGGVIQFPVVFSQVDEEIDEGENLSVVKRKTLIYEIIRQVVNHYGNENLSKIVISDVPLHIKEAVVWNSDQNVYIVKPSRGESYIYTTPPTPSQETTIYTYSKDDIIGFRYIDFFYPQSVGILQNNAGETVTSILDKIINILGNFEYFYDIEGRFIFREKRNFLNTTYVSYWTRNPETSPTEMPSEQYNSNLRAINQSEYDFNYNQLIVNFNNSLSYNNIKNDFVVWGTIQKNGVTKQQMPCRYHLAINKKPQLQTHYIKLFDRNDGDMKVKVAKTYPEGTSGAQRRDSSDWREEIYYQLLETDTLGLGENSDLNNIYFNYSEELRQFFPRIFDLSFGSQNYKAVGWRDDVLNSPQQLEYFLDFIDSDADIGKYSIENIGKRTKVVAGNNEKINSVFEPDIPDMVFVNSTGFATWSEYAAYITELNNSGQYWINVPLQFYQSLKSAVIPNSCFERIKDLLYEHTIMNDTVSFSAIPIYHLEPNTLITLHDAPSGIEGDYLIKSISLPLDINGTMNVNAYRVFDKL